MFIYVTGQLAYETAYRLYKENIVSAEKQFPDFFIKRFLDLKENMEEFHIEKNKDALYIREILRGGLFAALWELCEEAGCGCEIDFEKIPLRQDVVEILELFKENPYEASSKGSWLIFSETNLFGAALIGFTNETKDRIINFGNRKRYLTPARRQEKDIQNRKGER